MEIFLEWLTDKQIDLQLRCLVKFRKEFYEPIYKFITGYDPIPQIYKENQKVTLPQGNRAYEMPDKMVIWIKGLQDAQITFMNYLILHNGVENALNGFIKWMETWVHLPLCICQLEFEASANSDIANPEKFPLVYEFLKFRIWDIAIHQQQLEGLFNRYDMKINPNIDIHLQESWIQLSGLDGGIQEISQSDLRNIRQNANNLASNKALENYIETSRKEKAHEILNNFFSWQHKK
ncbi:27337_t:CDS:2 [Gigaspora margarita]|uniref:27337_t:CDS:1 n=1 Tax=Gigaspora margarita TaxID=4874 RepID=A0ABN7WDC1_GIGMA|nr:27337_t:CDS:2 [Gigaspora margarita]